MNNFFENGNQSTQNYILSGKPYTGTPYDIEDTSITKDIFIDNNDIYHSNSNVKDFLSNTSNIEQLVAYHEQYIAPKYRIKRDYYKGRHRKILDKPVKTLGKPDNRLTNNIPKKLTDTFLGFFIGDPIQIKYKKDAIDKSNQDDSINNKISDWYNTNTIDDILSEYARLADIYGRAYLRAFKYESEIRLAVYSPRDTFIVYSNDVLQTPLFAINYSTNGNGFTGTLITSEANYEFANSSEQFKGGKMEITNLSNRTNKNGEQLIESKSQNNFNILPMFELAENEERVGIFDNVIDLIDSVDDVLSSKNNDVNAISNAYLVITGVELTEEQLKNMSTNHLINLFKTNDASLDDNQTPEASFLAPAINDDMQENMINRLIDLIYQNSQVVNLNDNNFGMSAQSISGIALKQRYQAMQAKAKTKSNKMDRALRGLFTLLFNEWNVNADIKHLEFKHIQSIPKNMYEEAQTLQILYDKVPLDIAYGSYSGIDNPEKVAGIFKEEDEKNGSTIQNEVNKQLNGDGGNESDSNKE